MAQALNCISRHSAFIYDRGGKRRLDGGKITQISSIKWGRRMDGKSQAELVLDGSACDSQSELLNAIEPRRHELVIYRGNERVWEGPIVNTSSKTSTFTLTANDVLEYLDFTALSKDWPTHDAYLMLDRIRTILLYELQTNKTVPTNDGPVLIPGWENLDPPANILPYLQIATNGTTMTTSNTTAYSKTVGSHIQDLGQSVGVSYTTIGRALLFWDGVLSQTRTVTEQDFNGEFEVLRDGTSFHNLAHAVANQQTEGQKPVIGHAANDVDYYGPWEAIAQIEQDTGTSQPVDKDGKPIPPSQADMNSQARRDLYGLYPVPRSIKTPDGSGFRLGSSLGINDLVAGTNIPVRAQHNITPVYQMQRLLELTVTENGSGETISPQLEALGTVELVGAV